MQEIYNQTILTPVKVAKSMNFIDWNTQPKQFKTYPDFLYKYQFNEMSALKIIEYARCVTDYQIVGGKPYYRLNTPSAGNLHPIELYVQIRGVKGVISGIYHINPKEECLTLIGEIEQDGIELDVGMTRRFDGFIFILSIVPFRSEWKYADRAIRYCYLDAGHQLGALMASSKVLDQNCTILSDIDRTSLDHHLGFNEEEFSCMAIGMGNLSAKPVKPLNNRLMQVAPVDYVEGTRETKKLLSSMYYTNVIDVTPFNIKLNSRSLFTRRSARYFYTKALSKPVMDHLLKETDDYSKDLETYAIVLESESYQRGIYMLGECICEGDFKNKVSALMVNQHFLSNASVILVHTSKDFSPEVLMSAGVYVQKLHLYAQDRELGCTGIGAFYDTQVQKFLGTDNDIVYVSAIGVVL